MMNIKLKGGLLCTLLLAARVFNFSASIPDEGMFPLSELNRAGLKKAGLKIAAQDIYNPGQIVSVDALVQVSGTSGSSVSPHRLIHTTPRCATFPVPLCMS